MVLSRAKGITGFILAGLVLGSLAPAGAETLPAPRFRAERTYVHCGETPKAATVDVLQGNLPTWDATPPTTSVQGGAGCGTLDTESEPITPTVDEVDNTARMVWEGTFTGNLDSIVVHAHAIWAGAGRIEDVQKIEDYGLYFTMNVDGEEIDVYPLVKPKVVHSSTRASSEFIYTIDGFDLVDPVTDANGDGVADDEGTTEHTIKLRLTPKGPANAAVVWVWDTTEVPSGLHFNGPADGPVSTVGVVGG
jgi:hypothetical protein